MKKHNLIFFFAITLLATNALAFNPTFFALNKIENAIAFLSGWIGGIKTYVTNTTGGLPFNSGTGNGMFNNAKWVAVDETNGFIYVTDSASNHRIQKFNLSTGAFAGWLGRIGSVGGTCTAGAGLFTGGWCSGGTSSSGNGDGMFNTPNGVAVDSINGNIYVADNANHRIQKFNLSTGAFVGWLGKIATTGGTCTAGVNQFTGGWCSGGTGGIGTGDGMLNSPSGIKVDAANGFLFVTDFNNHRVQKFNLSTGAFVGWLGKIATTGGTCTAGVNQFTGGWCSGGTGGSGTGDGMLNSPVDVSLNLTNDHMFVTASGTHRVLKYTLSTGAFVGWLGKIATTGGTCTAGVNQFTGGWCTGGTGGSGTGDGMFNTPSSVSADVAHNRLYVADYTNHRVHKFTLSTGTYIGWLGKIATTGGTCTAGVNQFTGGWCTGGTAGSGAGDGMFNNPYGIAADSTNSTLYVSDFTNARLQKFNSGTGALIGISGAQVLGRPWVSSSTEIGASGTIEGGFSALSGATVDRTNGFFYVADAHRVQKFDLNTGAIVGWIGRIGSGGGTCTAGVGNFTGGWCSGGLATSGNGDGMFNATGGIAVDVINNHLYVAETTNHRVQKFNLSTGAFIGWLGKIATTGGTCTAGVNLFTGGWCSGGTSGSGTGDGMLNNPYGIAIDVANNALIVNDFGTHRIQRFNLSTGAFVGWLGKIATTGGTCTAGVGLFTGGWCSGGTSTSGTGDGMFNGPYRSGLDLVNGFLFVTDATNHRIQKFNLSTGAFVGWLGKIATTGGTCTAGVNQFTGGWCSGGTAGSGTGDGMFNSPRGLAADDSNGFLYVTEYNGSRTQKFNLATGAALGWIGKIATGGGTCTAGVGNFTGGWCLGGTAVNGSENGSFTTPSGAAVDGINKYLYVLDGGNYRVQRFYIGP